MILLFSWVLEVMKFPGQSQSHFFSHSKLMYTNTSIFTSMPPHTQVSRGRCSEFQGCMQRFAMGEIHWAWVQAASESEPHPWDASSSYWWLGCLLATGRQTTDLRVCPSTNLSIISRMSQRKQSAKDCPPRPSGSNLTHRKLLLSKVFKSWNTGNFIQFNLISCPC